MRVVCGVLAVLLVVFAITQYNDPDGAFWAAIYAVGAFWCGLAAFAPQSLAWLPARALLLVTLAGAIWGVVVFWPDAERWWAIDVWWPEASGETSREGMGIMVLAGAILVATFVALRRGRAGQGENWSERM